MMRQIVVETTRRCQMLDVTEQAARIVKEDGSDCSAVLMTVPHTTAGVTINECADPSVAEDILEYLDKLIPESARFRHSEGNSDAHIKSTLIGNSLLVPLEKGRMTLGTWQGIFFAEFDGPRSRKMQITLLK